MYVYLKWTVNNVIKEVFISVAVSRYKIHARYYNSVMCSLFVCLKEMVLMKHDLQTA